MIDTRPEFDVAFIFFSLYILIGLHLFLRFFILVIILNASPEYDYQRIDIEYSNFMIALLRHY